MSPHYGPWREPAEESTDLYPGLVVCDNRHSGSITVGRSRLPVSAFVGYESWAEVVAGWDYIEGPGYEWTHERHANFLYHLLEMRGEFARLLLVLADVERDEGERGENIEGCICPRDADVIYTDPACEPHRLADTPWWRYPPSIERVRVALENCLSTLRGTTD